MMNLFLFLPAIGWGIMPIIATMTKAKPINQLLGTTTMALLFGSIFSLFTQPVFTSQSLWVALISGCFWSFGQYWQFQSFQWLPVSEAMPISNGTQLIGTTAVAVILFKEWYTPAMIACGLLGITLIILGVIFTSYTEEKASFEKQTKKRQAIYTLGCSSVALISYITLPQLFDVSGAAVILPQAVGMWLASLLLATYNRQDVDFQKISYNFATGLAWSLANISLFLLMPRFGVAKSFTFSQFAVLLSLAAGHLIFKSQKTKKEHNLLLVGAALLSLGILLIGSLKS